MKDIRHRTSYLSIEQRRATVVQDNIHSNFISIVYQLEPIQSTVYEDFTDLELVAKT